MCSSRSGVGVLTLASAVDLTQFVFRGMRDSEDPQTENPEYARLIQNAYPIDTEMGTRVIGRPGCYGYGTRLGATDKRRVQGLYQWAVGSTQTEHAVCVVGGKLYTWQNVGSVIGTDWALQTVASATLSETATVYFTQIGDVLIVSDGVNVPFSWNGTTDTVLANCPVLYGQPTVYYAKLFGIKNTERDTIVWSEEADPATGYEAGGYNNAWTLGQTDHRPLTAIRGSNEALYYWRERSMGAIRGAVTTDFVTSGTRENVSATVGTGSPNGIVTGKEDFFFLDIDGRPRALNIASGILDDQMWRYLRETISDFDQSKLSKSVAGYDPSTDMVLLGCVADGSTECDRYIAISANTRNIAGIWRGWTVTAMGTIRSNVTGYGMVVMFGTANGYVYKVQDNYANDVLSTTDGGSTAISHVLTGSHLGAHIYGEKRFLRWDVDAWVPTDMALTFTYTTNRGTPTAQTKTIDLSSFPTNYHASVGLLGCGRWIIPSISHSALDQGFGVERWSVQSVPYSMEPDIP
jgi:hypothetical protein